ncbi:endonuclease [Kaistella polysaccharea]|uniref:endonuclease n=1 Tax=Kaistella polysaccharea TaxID=2878534 RepID=UPI001CF1EB83|nr:endonuclease [Kaistella polysaccharea]
MNRFLFALVFIPTILFSQAPDGYYAGTELLSGYTLKSKLHDIISKKNITWHYGDLPSFYAQTDIDHHYDYDASNRIYLLDLYSNNPTGTTAYHYTVDQLISSASGEGQGYNREHMMPQSTFYSNYPMYSDLYFVIPTDAKINQLRSNFPYGIAGSTLYYTFTNGSKIANNATPSSGYTGRVYEPVDEFKGDIARSLLYFSVRYEGKLGSFKFYNGSSPANDTSPLDGTEEKAFEDWYINMLLKWSKEDPVSPREIERNNSVFLIQKNRNPFIDHPEWVDLIWTQTSSVTAPETPAELKVEKTSAYFVTLNWSTSSDQNILGYSIYQNGVLIGKTKENNFAADHLNPSTAYQFTVRSYNRNYVESMDSELINVTTLENDTYAKDLFITKYLEGTERNNALEITNKTGHPVNLNKYRLSIQFYSGSNYYFPAPYELEGIVADNEIFVILNPNSNFSCVTNEDAKFVSAAPQMTFNGSNYLELRYNSTTIDAMGSRDLDNRPTLEDTSLYRLSTVNDPNSTFTLSEWTAFPVDYCEQLGVLGVKGIISGSNSEIYVYPNPVKNMLSIKGPALYQIKNAVIFDISGKQILKIAEPFKTGNSINVEKLSPGVFFLQVDNQTLKFIKE